MRKIRMLPLGVCGLLIWLALARCGGAAQDLGLFGGESLTNRPARIELIQPKDGEVFAPGRNIEFQAVAVDPRGYISFVEFFAGGRQIGESRIFFIRAPEPGTPITHQLVWTNAPPGRYQVWAKGISSSGMKVLSNQVEIVVEEQVLPPTLSLMALRPYLWEGNTNLPAQSSGFRLVRTGPVDSTLRVPIQIYGMAANGVDFVRITNVLTLLSGMKELHIPVAVLDDRLFERAETITLRLLEPVSAIPPSSVRPPIAMGASNTATIYILDNDLPATHPGTIEILKPFPGTHIPAPPQLLIEVMAAAHGSGIPLWVEVYADQRKIGDALSPLSSIPKSGTPIIYQMAWDNPPPGIHFLTARATNRAGIRLTSPPQLINLTSPLPLISVMAADATATEGRETDPAVFRVSRTGPVTDGLTVLYQLSGTASHGMDYKRLPGTLHFAAGSKTAEIVVQPLEDEEREGDETVVLTLALSSWIYGIGFPSNAVATLKDNDGHPPGQALAIRSLPDTYAPGREFTVRLEARPPAAALLYGLEDSVPSGWSVRGISHEGVFDAKTGKVKYGPFTDHQPRTLTYTITPSPGSEGVRGFAGLISIDGKSSPIGGDRIISSLQPGPHPADNRPADWRMTLDEVTAYMAGWMKGQAWPNGPNPIPTSYVTRAAVLWKQGENYSVRTNAGGPPQWWVPSVTRASPAERLGSFTPWAILNTASRELPPQYTPGVDLTVAITVTPHPEVLTYAVEDQPPPGWQISAINEGGQLDLRNGLVKWLFFDEEPRILTYTVAPPSNASGRVAFQGLVSFDSILGEPPIPISGQSEITTGAPDGPLLLGLPARLADGTLRLTIRGLNGGLTVLEASTDWTTWSQQITLTNATGEATLVVPSPESDQGRFFRARILP